jgi:hypothetical protein
MMARERRRGARDERQHRPGEAKHQGRVREHYVTYDLEQRTRGGGTAVYPKVKRVYIAGTVTGWEYGEFEKRSGRKARGVRIEYKQRRKGYERAGYTAHRAGTTYAVQPAQVRQRVAGNPASSKSQGGLLGFGERQRLVMALVGEGAALDLHSHPEAPLAAAPQCIHQRISVQSLLHARFAHSFRLHATLLPETSYNRARTDYARTRRLRTSVTIREASTKRSRFALGLRALYPRRPA